MPTNTKLNNAVKLAIAMSSGAFALSYANTAIAQDSGSSELEEVVVTGSRIPRKDFTSNAPVATIDAGQISITNTINTESLLNTLPQTVPGLDRTSNNPGNGTATVDLRGLGTNRTLVLIDGNRAVPTTAGGTVDINTIPNSLIQNVEVLTGGASAVYGSDAVAGVVNFILKKDFEGAAFNVSHEVTQDGDAGLTSADMTLGANIAGDRGNVVFNFSVTDRDDLFQKDRDFAFFAQFDSTDADGNPILIDGGSSGVPGTSIFAGGLGTGSGAIAPNSFGVTFDQDGSVREFVTEGSTNDFYNYAPVNYIQLPQTRYQGTALGSFKISDRAEIYGRSMYTYSKVPQQLAATPIFQTTSIPIRGNSFLTLAARQALTGNNTDNVGLGARNTIQVVDGVNGDPVFQVDAETGDFLLDDDGDMIPATSIGPATMLLDPDNEDLGNDPNFVPNVCANCAFDSSFADADEDTVDDDPRLNVTALTDPDAVALGDETISAFVRRRMLEVGPRVSDDTYTAFQVQAGIRGDINDNFGYDAYIQRGSVVNSNVQLGNVNRDRFDQAIALCEDGGNNGSTVACSPLNIFGEGNISQAAAAFIRTAVAAKAEFEQVNGGINIFGNIPSSTFELPGGQIGVAAGVEHRENDFVFLPSQDLAAGTIAGFNGAPASGGGYDVDAFYAEAVFPILDNLELELAARSEDYSTVGSVTAFKVAGSYAPIDQLRIRAGFNTAVRAPNIGELFAPPSEGFPGATDPCSISGIDEDATSVDPAVAAICTATGVPSGVIGTPAIDLPSGQVRALGGGNSNLKEEEADTFTVGVVVTPDFAEGLTFSVDYFDIEIDDAIAAFGGGAANILNNCYDPGPDSVGGAGSDFCNVINRRADGTIDFIQTTAQNVAVTTLKGVDIAGSYNTEVYNGDLNVRYLGTYTTESDFTPFDGAQTVECAGKFGQLCGEPLSDYNHRVTANWSRDQWTGQIVWRYVGEVDDDDPDTTYFAEKLDAENYFDASGSYAFNDNYTVSFGIDNLLDTEPPILGDNQQQANTFPATYDVFGRTFFVRGSATF